jgi:hypothetical protein
MGILEAGGSDPSTIEQLVTYGVPGALALTGVWLGKVWERRGGFEAWRRDQRMSSYSAFLAAIYKIREQAKRAEARESPEAYVEELNEMVEASAPVDHLSAAIRLVGPQEVWMAAADARAAFQAVFENTAEIGPPPRTSDLDDAVIRRAVDAEKSFLTAAQRALG